MQAMAAAILVDTIERLDLQWPTVSDEDRAGQRRGASSSWKPSQNDRTSRGTAAADTTPPQEE